MKHYIYKITNKLTKKSYIGSSNNPFIRWEAHILNKKNTKFGKELLNTSLVDWIFEVIEIIEIENIKKNKRIILESEKYWVDHYNTIKDGYNSLTPININVFDKNRRIKQRQNKFKYPTPTYYFELIKNETLTKIDNYFSDLINYATTKITKESIAKEIGISERSLYNYITPEQKQMIKNHNLKIKQSKEADALAKRIYSKVKYC